MMLQYLTRQALAKAGLPTPKNSRISKPEDVEPAGQHVGFPSVIKPVSGGPFCQWSGVLQPVVEVILLSEDMLILLPASCQAAACSGATLDLGVSLGTCEAPLGGVLQLLVGWLVGTALHGSVVSHMHTMCHRTHAHVCAT
jgi:hypothetical protein